MQVNRSEYPLDLTDLQGLFEGDVVEEDVLLHHVTHPPPRASHQGASVERHTSAEVAQPTRQHVQQGALPYPCKYARGVSCSE